MRTRSQTIADRRRGWELLPNEIKIAILSHYDVRVLTEKKMVCRSWRDLCTDAIIVKCSLESRTPFVTKQELCDAAKRYCGYVMTETGLGIINGVVIPTADEAERIARVHGWPINRWDVSTLTDFSYVFHFLGTFNEDISSWNVSLAQTMAGMFRDAAYFNQDLSTWDVSSVTDMSEMFMNSERFNGDIEEWDVSNVTEMTSMFDGASYFNRNLSEWDVGNVTEMRGMFDGTMLTRSEVEEWGNFNMTLLEPYEMPDIWDSE